MRWKLPALVMLALFLAPVATIHAAPADIGRKPDVSGIRCSDDAGGVCIARLVGRFNDDAYADILVERMSDQEFRSGMADVNLPRRFEIILGPFTQIDGQWDGKPAALLRLGADHVRAPVALADVDGMGAPELAFTSSDMRLPYEVQRVTVLFPSSWSDRSSPLNLYRASVGNIVIERQKQLDGTPAFAPNSRITPAFADLNADRKLDLILGIDPANLTKEDQARVHASSATSEIVVMFGDGNLSEKTGKLRFHDDLVFGDLGACGQSLAGVADVSGDGVADIVARQCPGDGLPDQLLVVLGGADVAQKAPSGTDAMPIRLPALDYVLRGAPALLPPVFGRGGVDGGDSPNVPPPSDPGRGYFPSGGGDPGTPVFPAPFFLEDVNGDGVRDIIFGLGDNTHIWLGGPDIAARVAAMRTDRVYVQAGYGRMNATSSWQPLDFNADGRRDLLLTGLASSSAAANGCPANARCAAPGLPPGSSLGGGQSKPDGLGTMRFFQRDWAEAEVLDAEQDAPDAVWQNDSLTPWGMGDFNGDGKVDLLLGEAIPGSHATADMAVPPGFSIAFGPFK